jgi:hypothetical protein
MFKIPADHLPLEIFPKRRSICSRKTQTAIFYQGKA